MQMSKVEYNLHVKESRNCDLEVAEHKGKRGNSSEPSRFMPRQHGEIFKDLKPIGISGPRLFNLSILDLRAILDYPRALDRKHT